MRSVGAWRSHPVLDWQKRFVTWLAVVQPFTNGLKRSRNHPAITGGADS
ncbi:MAG: hypothetical protein NVV59_04330 [Chitinophagaceae bacterium]|nr:hypothetical protein [Chitinophagaceae bacterium]